MEPLESRSNDLSVNLPGERTELELVRFVVEMAMLGNGDVEIEAALEREWGLGPNDATLARDRVFGGLVRAYTGRDENCPDKQNDPIAWESFQFGKAAPDLLAAICSGIL